MQAVRELLPLVRFVRNRTVAKVDSIGLVVRKWIQGEKQWRVMRRGVADMYRRAEVSQAANDRYAEALASLDTTTPLGRLAAMVCRPVSKDGKRYRALHPFSSEDRERLETNRGWRWGDTKKVVLAPYHPRTLSVLS
jgi:hypothetical protein